MLETQMAGATVLGSLELKGKSPGESHMRNRG